jgi:hypothetical protein
MAGTTTSQFGRRGAGLARTAARKPGASGASSALQTATGWNRTAPSDLPPDMLEAIAQANRTLSSRGPAIIDRGEMAPAPSLMTMLFSANGRIRRRDYWTFNIAASLCAVLAIVSAFLLLPPVQALCRSRWCRCASDRACGSSAGMIATSRAPGCWSG